MTVYTYIAVVVFGVGILCEFNLHEVQYAAVL